MFYLFMVVFVLDERLLLVINVRSFIFSSCLKLRGSECYKTAAAIEISRTGWYYEVLL
jgi:hypothetical protein